MCCICETKVITCVPPLRERERERGREGEEWSWCLPFIELLVLSLV